MKWWNTDLGKSLSIALVAVVVIVGGMFAWDALSVGEENAVVTACERAVEDRGGDDLEQPSATQDSDDTWTVRGQSASGLYWCEVSTASADPVVLTVSAN